MSGSFQQGLLTEKNDPNATYRFKGECVLIYRDPPQKLNVPDNDVMRFDHHYEIKTELNQKDLYAHEPTYQKVWDTARNEKNLAKELVGHLEAGLTEEHKEHCVCCDDAAQQTIVAYRDFLTTIFGVDGEIQKVGNFKCYLLPTCGRECCDLRAKDLFHEVAERLGFKWKPKALLDPVAREADGALCVAGLPCDFFQDRNY